MDLMDLDECVISALKLFEKEGIAKLKINEFKRPLVIGSGNAAATGKIIFEDQDAIFADESTYSEKIKSVKVDGAYLISASGSKHAPIIAKELKKKKIKTILLTNTKNSPAQKESDETFIFPKQPEPYTYNTSTYMSLILGKTGEDPKKIRSFISKLKIPKDIGSYSAYYIIVPKKFDGIREMLQTKFDELFGPMVNGRIFTLEQTKHAKTVVPSDKELFISFGDKNTLFGKNKAHFDLPQKADYAAMMAVSYYVIGHIQKNKPAYFKKNIQNYTKNASNIFGSDLKPIVN